MSHAATNWAIRQRRLKPAAKIVLWHLADRHNADTGQCNPKQARLAEDCEMSRSTLNLHLNELERLGLIRRIVSVDGETKRQRPTAYVLTGFEKETESENRTRKPCPKKPESRVRKTDSKNPVREPGKCARAGEAGSHSRRMAAIPVNSLTATRWEDWLQCHGYQPLAVLAERSESAGEAVWHLPIRSPPMPEDRIGKGIAKKWVTERIKAHEQGI